MAIKTTNRKTFSVDYNLDNLNLGFFNFTQYKGLCDTNNDITVDQNSFSELNNIYVDNNSVLASRSPIKFNDNDIFIADEWHIGDYGLRLYRIRYSGSENYYLYIISCFTHDLFTNNTDKFQAYSFKYVINDDNDKLEVPKVSLVEIEDKVFIWFAGQAIIVFNIAGEYDSTAGKTLPYFEDAYKYLYIPATTLVTNGFESELESKNFLTESYIKRYLYTTESNVDWATLEGKKISLKQIDDNGDEKKLYDYIADENSPTNLLYPYIKCGESIEGNFDGDYKIRVLEKNGLPIVARLNTITGDIEVSYGANIFHKLPRLTGILENSYPMITDDGLYIVCFTQTHIAFCNILSASSNGTQLGHVEDLSWELVSYYDNDPLLPTAYRDVYLTEAPGGRFKSRNDYVYIFPIVDIGTTYLHCHFRKDGVDYSYYYMDGDNANGNIIPAIATLEAGDRDCIIDFYSPDGVYPDANEDSNYKLPVPIEYLGPLIVMFVPSQNVANFIQLRYKTSGESSSDSNRLLSRISYGYKQNWFANYRPTFYEFCDISITPLLKYSGEYTGNEYHLRWEYDINISACALSSTFIPHNVFCIRPIVIYYSSSESSITIPASDYYQYEFEESGTKKYSPAVLFSTNGKALLSATSYFESIPEILGESRESKLGTTAWNNTKIDLPIVTPGLPLCMNGNNIYVLSGDTIHTNVLQSGVILQLDTYENVAYDSNDNMVINFRPDVPDCFAVLGNYYISFATITDGKFRLLASDIRRNDNNDFLLYLPERSEQRFSQRITNIHPLADNTMGIFTENEVWYISAINLDNESITRYTKAVKSKLPIGCRMGDEIITADNGQAILFATPRGIAYLTPEDFVATTDRVINYITNDIQNTYSKFYFNDVINANAYSFGITIPSQIRITKYSYWIFFYRYFDRYIYLLDTRSMTWWKWCTKYPILKIDGSKNLTFLLELEYAYIKPVIDDMSIYESNSFCGVSFIYCDKNYEIYDDDIIKEKLNGIGVIDGTYDIKTSVYGDRIVYKFAENTIDWLFMTQKLHFGAINNYKFIRSININTNGMGNLVTKFTTKVYRDLYHPEDSETVEIKINDLRSYVKRYNLMHVTNFTYGLENDTTKTPEQLSINSMSVKYEIKGIIR